MASIGALALFMANTASATLVLTVADADGQIPHPPGNINPTRIATAVGGGVTAADVGTMQYKDNRGGSEEGAAKTYYSTVFQSAGLGATVITWGGPGFISGPTYLVLKPGNDDSYVWDISGWNGTEEIQIPYPWTSTPPHAVSHVEIYGTTTIVPEPSTYVAGALLGLPFALGAVRRWRRSRA